MPDANIPAKFILLADDDPDDRLLFEEALKEIDRHSLLTVASDGEHLMEILDKKADINPTVIFLDLNMPKKNGFECLKEIRKTSRFDHIPVVVYSTSCQEESINKMYDHGASFYICKPNNFAKLKHSIEHIFSIGLNRLFPQPNKENFVIAF